jgi:acylpyruvate hydrolase
VVLLETANAVTAWAAGGALPEWGETDAATAHFARTSPEPQHILCIGLNYRSHIEQLERPMPAYPTLFAKFATTLTGPRDPIVVPRISRRVEGEVELAVVIGRTAAHVDSTEAAAAIAGYTVANDVSMRDWQSRTSEALQGKVFDRSTPLGPMLVTPDEVDDARDLQLSLTIDGTEWQTGTTSDMLFSPAELVSYCSTFVTLRPGDVILTGTPGVTQKSGLLAPGMTMVSGIEGLGTSINPLL